MIAHKHITKIIAAGMAAAVCLCLCTVAFSGPIAAAAGETGITMAYETALSAKNLRPDAIDILPGLMPGMIRKLHQATGLPVLTGGLITQKQEVLQALDAGALAISSTAPAVWHM